MLSTGLHVFKRPNADPFFDEGNHIYELVWAGTGLTLQRKDGILASFFLTRAGLTVWKLSETSTPQLLAPKDEKVV